MKIAVIVTLCIFWIAIAYRAYQHGDMMLAGVFILVGVVLTGYRISKLRG